MPRSTGLAAMVVICVCALTSDSRAQEATSVVREPTADELRTLAARAQASATHDPSAQQVETVLPPVVLFGQQDAASVRFESTPPERHRTYPSVRVFRNGLTSATCDVPCTLRLRSGLLAFEVSYWWTVARHQLLLPPGFTVVTLNSSGSRAFGGSVATGVLGALLAASGGFAISSGPYSGSYSIGVAGLVVGVVLIAVGALSAVISGRGPSFTVRRPTDERCAVTSRSAVDADQMLFVCL